MVETVADPWGTVIKKRSRLEMEKEQAAKAAQEEATAKDEDVVDVA